MAGQKLLISDQGLNRVIVFNSIPVINNASANLVLGESSLTSCVGGATASTLNSPSGVWSDGTRVVVADLGNNRVLIWNHFPTINGQPADLVLGQADMVSNNANGNSGVVSASTLQEPMAVTSNGTQLFVADKGNNRVLVWNSFPTINQQPADRVIGQPDFVSSNSGAGTSLTTLPTSVEGTSEGLLVSDCGNNRVLFFRSE